MAVAISAKIEGIRAMQARLRQINPQQNTRIIARSLRRAAGAIAENAKDIQIVGGGQSSKGLKPLKHRLTARTGRLRGDIGIDTKLLPFAVEVGVQKLVYGAVHEFGGRFSINSYKRRTPSGGTTRVRAHTRTYPARPFMQPALEAIRPKFAGIVREEWKREAKL